MMTTVRNIGPRECKKRLTWGLAVLGFSGIYFLFLVTARPNAYWWLVLLLSTFVGLIGLLQAVEQTCIVFASTGVRVMGSDGKQEKIEEPELVKKLHNKSVRLVIKAAMLAILLAGFYFMVPKPQ